MATQASKTHQELIPVPNPLINRSDLACWGCSMATGWQATGHICPVYGDRKNDQMMIRIQGECCHNKKEKKTIKGRVRVGQQKQRKF